MVFFPSAIVFPVFSPGVKHLSYPLRGLLEGVLMVFLMWIIIVILIIFTRFWASPSLIVAQSGGGDGFLFRPSRIPFLHVVRRWSPFAAASGSVALAIRYL